MATEKKKDSEVREGERIAKVMARAGLCSRRDAEEWIAAGRVSVNGDVLNSPAYNVGLADAVLVDGKPLNERQRSRLFMYHKPKGLITSSKDPDGRPTVFDSLPPGLPRVVSIGRLDINTEGLLLLTNDGGVARVLELPETGWLRRYRVRAHGEINQAQLDALKDGITLEGVNYAGIEARLERAVGSNVWLTMGLREGKNREIKRVLEHLGLLVNRLIRISFGPFELGELPEGEVDEIPTRVLRDQLGIKLAKRSGADFDSPVYDPPPPAPEPVLVVERGERPTRRDAKPERRGRDGDGSIRESRREGGTIEPRKRKHVSILRAEARAEAETERKRIVRSATSDRKGREVKVEHISPARPAMAAKPSGGRGAAPRARSDTHASATDGATKFRKPREGSTRDGASRSAAPRTRSYGDASSRDAAPRSRSYGDAPPREGAAKFRKPREASSRVGAPRSAAPPRARSFGDASSREAAPRSRSYSDTPPRDGAAKFRKPREAPSRDGAPRSRPPRDGAKRDSAPRGGGFKAGGASKGRPPGKGGPAGPKGGSGGGKRPARRPS